MSHYHYLWQVSKTIIYLSLAKNIPNFNGKLHHLPSVGVFRCTYMYTHRSNIFPWTRSNIADKTSPGIQKEMTLKGKIITWQLSSITAYFVIIYILKSELINDDLWTKLYWILVLLCWEPGRTALLPCQGKTRVCTAPSPSSFPYSLCLTLLQKVNSDFWLCGQDSGNFPPESSKLFGFLITDQLRYASEISITQLTYLM